MMFKSSFSHEAIACIPFGCTTSGLGWGSNRSEHRAWCNHHTPCALIERPYLLEDITDEQDIGSFGHRRRTRCDDNRGARASRGARHRPGLGVRTCSRRTHRGRYRGDWPILWFRLRLIWPGLRLLCPALLRSRSVCLLWWTVPVSSAPLL